MIRSLQAPPGTAPPVMAVASRADPAGWLRDYAATVREQVCAHGAVVVRGLPMRGAEDLAGARHALGLVAHDVAERLTPRDDLGHGVVSPIHWPDDRELCPFQEGSANLHPPTFVLTACADQPGEPTVHHLSDLRRLADTLPEALVARLREDGWALIRTFHEGFAMSWQEAFSVATRDELEALLLREQVEASWQSTGALRTTRRRVGLVEHPDGRTHWVNDLTFFHTGSLDPEERAIMAAAFGDDLPMRTAYGDGSPVPDDELAALQRGYTAHRQDLTWAEGDLLVVDNLAVAQGRPPLTGRRQLLVALADDPRTPRRDDTAAPG